MCLSLDCISTWFNLWYNSDPITRAYLYYSPFPLILWSTWHCRLVCHTSYVIHLHFCDSAHIVHFFCGGSFLLPQVKQFLLLLLLFCGEGSFLAGSQSQAAALKAPEPSHLTTRKPPISSSEYCICTSEWSLLLYSLCYNSLHRSSLSPPTKL